MHPSPMALRDMSTSELQTYRAELEDLEAEHGSLHYRDRITQIDRILFDRKRPLDPWGTGNNPAIAD